MAVNPHSEHTDSDEHHSEDRPEDWGWHAEWGGAARVAGWIVAIVFIVMLTATHYNHSGSFWLVLAAVGLIVVLIWDGQRRKNAWRK